MGQIASTYDIMPESTDVDLQKVIAAIPGVIPAGVELKETSVKPVAFGLEKVVAFFVILAASAPTTEILSQMIG